MISLVSCRSYRTGVALVVLLLVLGTTATIAQSVYDTADRFEILPTPRSISLQDDPLNLQGWEIVVPRTFEQGGVVGSEINGRIQELGGSPLPVVRAPTGERPAILVGRWWDPQIRSVSMALDVTLTPTDPGPQGYVIGHGQYNGRSVILLGGSDRVGALYASVTFRRLLQQENGGVVVHRATVRDWPDFKLRNNGRLDLGALQETNATLSNLDPLYAAAEDLKDQIDFFFRHKVNVLYTGFFFRSSGTDPELFDYQKQLAAEVIDYAQIRGIQLRTVGGVEISEYLTPEQREASVTRSPGTSYMWAAFPAHRTNARRYADYLGKMMPNGIFSLHLDDQGGYIDPERWSRRSPASQAMYGDDKNQATLEQFLLYFEPARAAAPDIGLEIIPYPYHFQFGVPDFPDWYTDLLKDPALVGMVRPIRDRSHAETVQEDLISYHKELAADISDDAFVVFREANRAAFEACARLYENHPITIWIYPDRNGGWHGSFTPQVRMAKTFWRPAHRDLYFVASSFSRYGDGRVQRLAQQEYLWNVNRPDGSAAFSQRMRGYEAGGQVTSFQKNHLIPRISRILYGEQAAAFSALSSANVSFGYVSEPEDVAITGYESENFDRVMEHMADQAQAMDSLHATFEDAYEAYDTARPSEKLTPWIPYFYRYTGLAAVKARLHATEDRVRRMLEQGNQSQARQQLSAVLDHLSEMETTVANLRQIDVPGGRSIDELDSFGIGPFEKAFRKIQKNLEGENSSLRQDQVVRMEGVGRTTRTVTYGYSTIISYRLRLGSSVNAKGKSLVLTVRDQNGNRIATRRTEAGRLSNQWLGMIPGRVDLGLPYYGRLGLEVQLFDPATGERRTLGRFEMTEDAEIIRKDE